MDPRSQFGPNPHCPARAQTAQGQIRVHSDSERGPRGLLGPKTFAASTGPPFSRLPKDPALVLSVVTGLA